MYWRQECLVDRDSTSLSEPWRLPEEHNKQPLSVRSFPLSQSAVSEADLNTLLYHTQLGIKVPKKLSVGDLLHSLRLWKIPKDLPTVPSLALRHPEVTHVTPAQIVNVILTDRAYVDFYGDMGESNPLFFRTPAGLGVLRANGTGSPGGEPHVNKLLQVLGECGFPLNQTVRTAFGEYCIEDILRDAVYRFSINQELEFSATAFANYLPPDRSWVNKFGDKYSFDDLALRLIERSPGEGACYGIHVLFALTVMQSADDIYGIFSDPVRIKVRRHLTSRSRLLERTELIAGGWDKHWGGSEGVESPFSEPALLEYVRVTGHHLEWIALASPEYRPPEPVIRRAIAGVVQALKSMSFEQFMEGYGPCSHAVRAIMLLEPTLPPGGKNDGV
jgi:hypothetical protein